MGRPLPDVTPNQVNLLTVVEGVQSRFFQATTAVEAVEHVCQARFESPVGKSQHLCKPPDEQELGGVQEART